MVRKKGKLVTVNKCSVCAGQLSPEELLEIIDGTNKVRFCANFWGLYRVFQKEASILGS